MLRLAAAADALRRYYAFCSLFRRFAFRRCRLFNGMRYAVLLPIDFSVLRYTLHEVQYNHQLNTNIPPTHLIRDADVVDRLRCSSPPIRRCRFSLIATPQRVSSWLIFH